MKKFSFILAMGIAVCTNAFGYERIGQLNPYAYGVTSAQKGTKVSVKYSLNAPATATEIVVYCDGQEVGTVPAADNATGMQGVVVDLANFGPAGTYTFGIRVHGNSVTAPTPLREVLDDATDTTIVHYAFYHPQGVDVDNNPFSSNFGRLLVTECHSTTPNEGYHSSVDKQGVYAFDPTFAPIPNGNSRAFKGNATFASTHSPYRIRISGDSRIFLSSNHRGASADLWELSADLQTWTPILGGSFNEEGILTTVDGNYKAGANAGLDLIGEGEDLQILMLNYNTAGAGAYNGTGFFIDRYNIGTSTSEWVAAPSEHTELSEFIAGTVPVDVNCGITDDGEGGFWYKSARANVVDNRGFAHVNAEGVVDFELHATAADTAAYNLNINGSNGGSNIRLLGDELYLGMGQRKGGTGHLQVFTVGKDAVGAPTLTIKYELDIPGISRNLNDFAVDFARNLYVVGNSNEKLVTIQLPYDGAVETPVAIEVQHQGSAVDNLETAPVIEKRIENGQVVIYKDGVRFNVLGAQL